MLRRKAIYVFEFLGAIFLGSKNELQNMVKSLEASSERDAAEHKRSEAEFADKLSQMKTMNMKLTKDNEV